MVQSYEKFLTYASKNPSLSIFLLEILLKHDSYQLRLSSLYVILLFAIILIRVIVELQSDDGLDGVSYKLYRERVVSRQC